ncbi:MULTISPECIES: hypothetical protein [Streptomyces]|uniref:Uncharacterized protein n=1 Tax=Streptomyces nigrescens TaxID=1920 RepID=A0ABY7IVP8_STRNI|nr:MULTISPECIES: hypothetical protein [Streptomyces]AWN24905.1 hypothetical protein DKG71_00835 [Streptomyces sp. NEAU-S7GS2]WAU02092.1 hypothetical protein STRNI_000043 [Streptomyces nigrescens]
MTDRLGPHIVVHPPSVDGGRRLHVDARPLGVAYDVADLLELLRRAGLDPEEVRLNDPMIK